jgi:pimeloyl-ACP methyl ester carboxylesterase
MGASKARDMILKKKILVGCLIGLLLPLMLVTTLGYLYFHEKRGDFFDSNGVRIHYAVEGKGEPVILIHGLGANGDINWRRPGTVRLLAQDFQVITFDCRGHGLSDRPEGPDKYGIEMVEDVVRLMDHLKIDKAHIAGYSMGGFILLKLMMTHPERVRSAAICGAGWRSPADRSPLPDPFGPLETGAGRPRPIREALRDSTKSFHGWIAKRFGHRETMSAIMIGFSQLLVGEKDLESNKIPAICLVGKNDGLKPLAEDLEKHMPNTKLITLENVNHLTTPFSPEFRKELDGFFMRHRGAP